MNLGMSERVRPLVEAVRNFITGKVRPLDGEFFAEVEKPQTENRTRYRRTGPNTEIPEVTETEQIDFYRTENRIYPVSGT